MNTIADSVDLQKEVENSKKLIEELKKESDTLRKAIWDMINYSNMYVVLLDSDLNIKLINYSLAIKLGFKNEEEPIGKNWLEFIPEDSKEIVKTIHCSLAFKKEKKYFEVVTDVMDLNGKSYIIKWFNAPINSRYNMTFSSGIEIKPLPENIIMEDSVRSYYKDIIQKDRTMIKSLRDLVIKKNSNDDVGNVCGYE